MTHSFLFECAISPDTTGTYTGFCCLLTLGSQLKLPLFLKVSIPIRLASPIILNRVHDHSTLYHLMQSSVVFICDGLFMYVMACSWIIIWIVPFFCLFVWVCLWDKVSGWLQTRYVTEMTLNLWYSYLHFPCSGIVGMHYYLFFAVLQKESRASYILGKCSISSTLNNVFFLSFYFKFYENRKHLI